MIQIPEQKFAHPLSLLFTVARQVGQRVQPTRKSAAVKFRLALFQVFAQGLNERRIICRAYGADGRVRDVIAIRRGIQFTQQCLAHFWFGIRPS
jgi:hypothetical protein